VKLSAKNQQGVSSLSIILFGLLTLSLVLLDGISITLNNNETYRLLKGKEKATASCFKANDKFPPECYATSVYKCDSRYILDSNCLGVGNVILDKFGDYYAWCGYNSLEGNNVACGKLIKNKNGGDCLKTKNLCK
jgi:hypothetical protein